jgi:AraC-like DNA-binding protein
MLARDAGIPPEDILDGSATTWDDIDALEPVDLDSIIDLFDRLAAGTPPGFAIRSANASKVRSYGLVGFATMSMPTLRQAFQHWSRYCLIGGDPVVTTIVEEGDTWRMLVKPRVRMSARAERYCLEAAIAAIEPVIEELTERPANTIRIDFGFLRPRDGGAYHLLGTRDIRFNRAETVYHGLRKDLDRPIPACDSAVSAMFLRQCDEYLTELTHGRSLVERLNDLLRVSNGIPSLDEMAEALGTSGRSLQRALSACNQTYQQVVRDFRIRHAKMLLSERQANVKTISHMLGFKDVSCFRREFQKRTGQSIGRWQSENMDFVELPKTIVGLPR